MGCINSTKKLNEVKNENNFRVRVVCLQPESPAIRCGFLELSQRELIFDQGRQPVFVWALQHLRRYGLNEDIFSFEAGRRCMSGPGIYTFRCQQADRLYQLFQRYLNAVSLVTEETVVYTEREHPSQMLGRSESQVHSNNYLEPTPIRYPLRESFSSSPLTLELDSPDSVPSLSFTNEVVHFQNHPSYVNTNVNLYLDHPLKSNTNPNTTNIVCNRQNGQAGNQFAISGPLSCGSNVSNGFPGGTSSPLGTLSKSILHKDSSLDLPPNDLPPITPLLSASSVHMYANVQDLTNSSCLEETTESYAHCYENLNTCNKDTAAVNYIVLDLDQPRSPAQFSPKTCFGSGLSLATERLDSIISNNEQKQNQNQQIIIPNVSEITNDNMQFLILNSCGLNISKTEDQNKKGSQKQITSESSLGYSTIDFIKTCALIKSSTHSTDFEGDPEESRVTRHSKCVRKAYSISE